MSGDKICLHGNWLSNCQTCYLAQQAAEMPKSKKDEKSINEWAERLASDISKGRD